MAGRLFLVSAPSGGGKTTLVNAAIASLSREHSIKRLITYTSRSPRTGDVHGVDYHFVTPAEFQTLIEQEFFLEWSAAYGTFYGTPKEVLRDIAQGLSYIAIVDRAGAQAIYRLVPD